MALHWGAPIPLFKPPQPPACSVQPGATSVRYAARTSSGERVECAYGVAQLVSPFTSAREDVGKLIP